MMRAQHLQVHQENQRFLFRGAPRGCPTERCSCMSSNKKLEACLHLTRSSTSARRTSATFSRGPRCLHPVPPDDKVYTTRHWWILILADKQLYCIIKRVNGEHAMRHISCRFTGRRKCRATGVDARQIV
eukprot:TRINITY_DN63824_c0_g1_i1.p1 TRINITY_DN63824_c0_g1~~TRINITY_DN63824_c0_g1_i1.p1  ORF type:complete len:129 (+),score=9.98 TRINITY_DN63824_c0_g1_i1:112-498(+)